MNDSRRRSWFSLKPLVWGGVLMLGACASRGPAMRSAEPAPGLRAEASEGGRLVDRLAPPDQADLVIFYGTDEEGSLEPCGCTDNPRGGLPRFAGYLNATRALPGASPDLVLSVGGWSEGAVGTDGAPRPDASLINGWMVRGMTALGVDVVGVGWGDMAGMVSLDGPPPFAVVSANLHGDGVAGEALLQRGDLRVLVTSIGSPGPAMVDIPGFVREDGVDGVRAQLQGARERADLIVLLAHSSTTEAKVLAEEGLVDLVIDANQHRFRDEPLRVGGAVWVRAYHQTQRLGELRIGLESGEKGPRIRWATDRKIDLDEAIPEEPELRAMARDALREIERTQRSLFGQVL